MVKETELANEQQDAESSDIKRRDQMSQFYEKTFRNVVAGSIVKGKITAKTNKEVIVDIGYKSEGLVSFSEFDDPDDINIGDEVEVLVESLENVEGMVTLSKRKAESSQGWERIIATYKEGDVIEGKISRKIKGGFMVNIGIEAFLPASLATIKGHGNLDDLVGALDKFKIVKINKPRKNIVVSRKDYLLQHVSEQRERLLKELTKGQLVVGTVKNITDFGAFIDLGGIDGLLHITDMSWGRISHPSEMLAIGDKVEVMVLDFDKESTRVSLGLKQKSPNPWLDVDAKYPVGSHVKGAIVNLMPYGAFVELEKGVEGLVHISEFSWTKRYNHPSELLAIGDAIEVVVLDMDKDNRKISLGIKQLEQDPWAQVEEKYPVGSKVKGKLHNMTDYGAFVELEEGVDGLIHVSDMSWTKRVSHPKEVLKKGQKVEAVVLTMDRANRRIALGLKQLTPNPWPELVQKYTRDTVTSGTVTKIADFGVFVALEEDLEGLLHISEIDLAAPATIETAFKVGDKIKVKVLGVDPEAHKIALSAKGI